ncbi:MAG: hypothetical protein RJP95_00645 [Pirellulales bacterium]
MPVVVTQQATKTFLASDHSLSLTNFVAWFDDPVSKALVISLAVIMCRELPNGIPQRLLAAEDHAI